MHPRDGTGRKELAGEVPVGHRIHAVLRNVIETELPRHETPVQDNSRSGQRPRSERQHIGAPGCVGQTPRVAFEHFHVGQHMMRRQHRLRPLQMGVAGHDGVTSPHGEADERFLQTSHRGNKIRRRLPHPEPQIRGHLVVA